MTPEISELLLLDTHAWLWVLNEDPKARRSRALAQIENAAQTQRLKISPISIWEVSMLEAHGRLTLPVPLDEWIDRALSAPGVSLAGLDPSILIESTRLPGDFSSDPADCMLIATARHLNARLVTADRKILHYGRRHFVKTLAF